MGEIIQFPSVDQQILYYMCSLEGEVEFSEALSTTAAKFDKDEAYVRSVWKKYMEADKN